MSTHFDNILLQNWLSFDCDTEEVNDLFRKSMKKHNLCLAVLTFSELANRGEESLIMHSIDDAKHFGYIESESTFATWFKSHISEISKQCALSYSLQNFIAII